MIRIRLSHIVMAGLLAVAGALTAQPASAQLRIDVTQGVTEPLPIAFAPLVPRREPQALK